MPNRKLHPFSGPQFTPSYNEEVRQNGTAPPQAPTIYEGGHWRPQLVLREPTAPQGMGPAARPLALSLLLTGPGVVFPKDFENSVKSFKLPS